MKRLLSLIIIMLILIGFSSPITSYADTSGYENIKIGLYYASTSKQSVNLTCYSGFVLGYEQNGQFNIISELAEKEISVSVNQDGLLALSTGFVNDTFSNLEIQPGYGHMLLNGQGYRGSFVFEKNSTGKMTVINKVNLEEYLYSVLGREMSPSWPIEALKAQAICARTYAINNWNKYSSYGFNLDNTQNSQVYDGMRSEGERTIRAVNETKGQLLMYDGKPAQTFYYSSSGGKTANVKYVWGSSFPYLISVDDPYENPKEISNYNWTVTFSQQQMQNLVDKAGIKIGDVTNVEVVGADNGTVYNVKITGTEGTHSLKNSAVRTFFGLKSQYYTISNPGASVTYPNVTIIGANGISTQSTNNICIYPSSTQAEFNIISSNGLTTLSPTSSSGGTEYVFNGHGWGHRIGMSQWGAKGMADKGFSAIDILTHYFSGCYVG